MEQTKHPWHIEIGDKAPAIVKAIIEIPQGSQMKYELDKPSGLLKLDRVLHSAVHYPMNYGLIPQTYYEDNDPLDILVMCSFPIEPLCVVEVRVVGMMEMIDENGTDNKILAVVDKDPSYHHIRDVVDIPFHKLEEVKNFFATYKLLEEKAVTIGNVLGKEIARKTVLESVERYKAKFKI